MSIYKHSNQNKSILVNEPANNRKKKVKSLSKKVWEEAVSLAFQFIWPEIQV